VTQIANGLSTTTFTYDNNGNVTQKTTDGTTTTYVYDYANRLTALGAGGATTTYEYDAFGQRMFQTGTTTTYLYPFKWYSVASSTGSGVKFATTTDYVFNSDSLVATVDQQTASGNATGTAKTRYIHPDHLGSTNVVTDENDNVVQTLDYLPYGSTRISSATSTNERRKFIGQFVDDSTLSYLNARYYDTGRGEFMSEDPVFWTDPKQRNLTDPQALNTYSYSADNPLTKRDPSGKYFEVSVSGTDSGLSGSLALQFTFVPFVVNFFPAGGFGGGLEGAPFSASYTPGPVPQEDPGTISYGGDAALGGGLGYNRSGSYVPQTASLKNQSTSWSFVVGAGADVYARKEYPIALVGSTYALIGGSAPRGLSQSMVRILALQTTWQHFRPSIIWELGRLCQPHIQILCKGPLKIKHRQREFRSREEEALCLPL
jgi:RHS repeat-associated protein